MTYSSSYSSSLDSSTSTTTTVTTATEDETSTSSISVDLSVETSTADGSEGLGAALGGDAIATGEDTLTVGSASASLAAGGAVTSLDGTVDMLAAAEAPEGGTAQALTETFAGVTDGAEFVFTYNVETDSTQQGPNGSTAVSGSTTGITAYNLEPSGGGGQAVESGSDDALPPPETIGPGPSTTDGGDDGDWEIDGNIAVMEFDATASGEDTVVTADAFTLAIEDELSASGVAIELAAD